MDMQIKGKYIGPFNLNQNEERYRLVAAPIGLNTEENEEI